MNNKFDILWYLPAHFVHMFGANTVYQQHESASYPWEWLLGLGKIPIFINTAKNAVIVLSGNQIAWLTVPGALLFGWVILSGPRREKWLNISKEHLSVVVWGFVFFFVPFLFVGRVVFLYHYFSALLCGYLLVPIVIKFSMQKWGKWVWEGYLGLVLLGFMLTAPVTYALRVWSPWIEILTK
jgi:dolichyl-phosphate-mannose--protein O-mannosyl transferase